MRCTYWWLNCFSAARMTGVRRSELVDCVRFRSSPRRPLWTYYVFQMLPVFKFLNMLKWRSFWPISDTVNWIICSVKVMHFFLKAQETRNLHSNLFTILGRGKVCFQSCLSVHMSGIPIDKALWTCTILMGEGPRLSGHSTPPRSSPGSDPNSPRWNSQEGTARKECPPWLVCLPLEGFLVLDLFYKSEDTLSPTLFRSTVGQLCHRTLEQHRKNKFN